MLTSYGAMAVSPVTCLLEASLQLEIKASKDKPHTRNSQQTLLVSKLNHDGLEMSKY